MRKDEMKRLNYLLFTFLFSLANLCFASEEHLLLIDNKIQIEIPLEQLREEAKTEFIINDPFQNKELKVKGILLETLFQQYLSSSPKNIKLVAMDDYEVSLNYWQKNHWLIVTHENGIPISLRQRGPLRLVERGFNHKDQQNLRSFNDWIWMLKRIEIQ